MLRLDPKYNQLSIAVRRRVDAFLATRQRTAAQLLVGEAMSQAAAHGLITDMENDGLKDLLVYTVAGAAPQAVAAGVPGAAANPPEANPAAANAAAAIPIVAANPEGQHAADGQGQAAGNQATATVLTDGEMCTFLKTRTASSTFYATLISSDGVERELEFEVVGSGRDGRGTVRPVTRDGPPNPRSIGPWMTLEYMSKRYASRMNMARSVCCNSCKTAAKPSAPSIRLHGSPPSALGPPSRSPCIDCWCGWQ
jgi:hypothetical protein